MYIMKKQSMSLVLALALSGCATTQYSPDREALLSNPLYAEILAENMVDTMVNLEIYNDPILEDEEKKQIADSTKEQWLAAAKVARALQREGAKGQFIPMKEYAEGEVLLLENNVHFSTFFNTVPGPSLHVFLSKAVDPRDVRFPDESALDLGEMTVPYGAQSYAVPETDALQEYRTVVLWDTELDRLYAFAQISQPF